MSSSPGPDWPMSFGGTKISTEVLLYEGSKNFLVKCVNL